MTPTVYPIITAIAFGCGWHLRGRRASRDVAIAARINCAFMMALRKGVDESRLDELRQSLTAQARVNLQVWQSLGGHRSTPRRLREFFTRADEPFFMQALREFEPAS